MLAAAGTLGVLVPAATGEFHYFQPSERPGALEDLVRPTNEHPAAAVAYFTIDSGFVIAFAAVFVGLFVLTKPRAPQFARFALAAGVWTAIADAIENALYWTYAMRAQAGVALVEFDTPLLPVLGDLRPVLLAAPSLPLVLVFARAWSARAAADRATEAA